MQSGDLQQAINCYNIDLGIPTVIFLSCKALISIAW